MDSTPIKVDSYVVHPSPESRRLISAGDLHQLQGPDHRNTLLNSTILLRGQLKVLRPPNHLQVTYK